VKSMRDPDFEEWLDGQEPPEQTPAEVEAEEAWIKRMHESTQNPQEEESACLPRKSR
jgi:hypothetical protein